MTRDLRDIIDEQEETIRQLREMLAPSDLRFPKAWGLTPSQTKILRALIARSPNYVSGETLVQIASPKLDDFPDIKLTDVHICHLRRKIRSTGAVISTVRSMGFRIDAASKKILLAHVEAEAARDGRLATIITFSDEDGEYLEFAGEIGSPAHLEETISALRCAAARIWPNEAEAAE